MIYIEDQVIKLGGVVLPGLLKSIEVTETAKIDEQDVEGSAAKPKQATGYEDAKINIELILDDTPTQTKYERLATLRSLFRKPGQAVPQPISIVCEDTTVHGIDQVLFKDLKHKAESKKDQIAVTLEFCQYVSQTIKVQKQSSTKSGGTARSTRKSKSTSKKSSSKQTQQKRIPPITEIAAPYHGIQMINKLKF